MRSFLSLFAACLALLGEAIGGAEAQGSVPQSVEVPSPTNQVSVLDESSPSPVYGGERKTALSLPAILALLAATAAAIFLILRCVKILQSNKNANTPGENARSLAEGASDQCNVGAG